MTAAQVNEQLSRIETALAALALIADDHADTGLAEAVAHMRAELEEFKRCRLGMQA